LLVDSYRLVMPDLRGHGWTEAPMGGYDKEQLATDLLGLLDALELDEVTLVGHDWGGWTGFLACLRAPERFRGFVALGVTHPFQRPDTRVLQMWRMGYQLPLSTPFLADLLLRGAPGLVDALLRSATTRPEAMSEADRRAYSEVLRDPARARASSRLYRTFVLTEGVPVMLGRYRGQRLRVPTRLLSGAHDPVVTPALLSGWEEHAEDMTVEVLPGCGHFVPEEEPEIVAGAVQTLAARSG
jgi:pimeloyl-ACP methyl ester carboxylesterase